MIYYIRAKQEDWPQVVAMAKMLGIVSATESGSLAGDGWVYVGPICRPTGSTITVGDLKVPEAMPVIDENGVPYVHINVVYEGSLRELAESKAQDHPEIAEALGNLSRWFVTDDEDRPRAPNNPAVVIF